MKLINQLKSFRRILLMKCRCVRFGLKHAHSLAYVAPGVRPAKDIVMEPYSFINVGCLVGPGVELGRYAMLGPRVMLVGNDHRFDSPGTPIIFAGRPMLQKTLIKDDAWVGAGAIIMAGVTIGRGSIVGAGSVVTKSVPDYEIHAGVPAKKIRDRFRSAENHYTHEKMLNGELIEGGFCQRQR